MVDYVSIPPLHKAPSLKAPHPTGRKARLLTTGIIDPDSNVWSMAHADRLAFLVDAAAYFQTLSEALQKAQNEIWIIGWDFHPQIDLTPDQNNQHRLSDLLQAQLDAKPDLVIRILVWALGPLYSGKSLRLYQRPGVLSHERVHLQFATSRPLWSSHHQKIVVIDDALAFIGGIDLTAGRWDDSKHQPANPLRTKPNGLPYEPVHDLQVMVAGKAAKRVSDIARHRWWLATAEKPMRCSSTDATASLWPKNRKPDLSHCRVGLSLMEPPGSPSVLMRHFSLLALDAIKAAQNHIYIEAQYLTSFVVADALAERLMEEKSPEIIILTTRVLHGFMERIVMETNRDRIIHRLKQADKHNRLRVMYAVVPDDQGQPQQVFIHSKLLIIDDCFVRIGSSNLNNRSEGIDTEADLSVEAYTPEQSAAIAALRHRLLAEHLDSTPTEIANTFKRSDSLIATIDAHNTKARGLRNFIIEPSNHSNGAVWVTPLVDPSVSHPTTASFAQTLRAFVSGFLSRWFRGSAPEKDKLVRSHKKEA